MATLNTLRTRFGVVLSAVIAFALLAFIFSLKAEMGFMGGEPIVAKIDGHNVTYTEYQAEYSSIQRMSGADGSNEQVSNMIYGQTWQRLFSKFALIPALNKIGLDVTEEERADIVRGNIPTQTMYGAFSNPSTGVYDVAAVNNFLLSSQGNPEAEMVWATVNEQACSERLTTKFAGLVAAGAFVNSLEIEKGVEAANKSYSGRWVSRRYRDVADSLVTVSAADVKAYYDQNKAAYKRQPSRSISYVEFKIEPSNEDLTQLANEARRVANEFGAADDIRAFIRTNRNGSVADNFLAAAQLPKEEIADLTANKMYGPVKSGEIWRTSRVLKSMVASDTLSVRHIVLSYTDRDLADSLLVALRKGGDFAAAATTYSVYTESAQNGGDIGKVPFSAFSEEFANKLSGAKRGDIVEIESGDMIQLMQVYDAGKRVPHYQVAAIEMPILPSDETRRTAHNAAGLFAVATKKVSNADGFKEAAGESKVVARNANLTSASRTIQSVDGSTEVARWAHRAEVGDISEIFKVADGYVIAMLVGVNNSEYRTINEVESVITRQLQNDKKYELIKGELRGATLDAQAEAWGGEVANFEDVKFDATFIRALGVEPRLVGEITSTTATGVMSEPVKGNTALYLFEVSTITEAAEPQSVDDERVKAESMVASMVQQQLFSAIESLSNIEDLRGQSL